MTLDTDTAPVRPGRASSAALDRLPRNLIQTLQNPPPRIANGPINYVEQTTDPVALYVAENENPIGQIDGTLRQGRMERTRAAWVPIPELGGYMWDVWVDADDPSIQVAAAGDRTRFLPQTNRPDPTALRTDETVGAIPPYGMVPAHELRVGQVVLAGFGYAHVHTITVDHDLGQVAIRLELPTSLLIPTYSMRRGDRLSPYLSITRDLFAGVPVHALAAPLGSHRSIAQSPGHRPPTSDLPPPTMSSSGDEGAGMTLDQLLGRIDDVIDDDR